MIEAQISPDELQRLETLRTLQLLDSAPEERFDRLTRLAKRMFNVPISFVSLIDKERLWCKSVQGMNIVEMPRSTSLCAHAILGDGLFLIPNAKEDERFRDNPLVINDPHIRFYAAYPLKVENGYKMGTLSLIDNKPRNLVPEDQALLKDLASMAEQEIASVQISTLDELTKISNRRGFMSLASHSLNLCKRNHQEASLVLFDLDDFKPINDQFGHAEGDRALIAFSNLLKQEFRDSDVFARIGGDEFIALLIDTGEDKINQILKRFEEATNDYNKKSARGYDLKYSAGFVIKHADETISLDQLIENADIQMYKQKKCKR